MGNHKRQIALHQLLLQGDGGAGYDEALVARLRHDAACEQVGKGFAYACGAFNHGDAFALAVGSFAAFFARERAGKGVGDGGDHFALGGAGAEVGQVFGDGAVVVADGVFF